MRAWTTIFTVSVLSLAGCAGGACPEGTMPVADACVPVDAPADVDAVDVTEPVEEPVDLASCTPTGEADDPDPDFVDADCDGIDGAIGDSVFVAG